MVPLPGRFLILDDGSRTQPARIERARGGEVHHWYSLGKRDSVLGAAIAAAADSPVTFKSRESHEGAAVSLIFLGESGGFETGWRSLDGFEPGATSARGGQIQPEIWGIFGGFIPSVNNGEHIRL